MLLDRDRNFPAHGTNGHIEFVDIEAALDDIATFPIDDLVLQLKNHDEREGARIALDWLLKDILPEGAAVKLAALRYLLRREPRPMRVVAQKLGVSKQAISKQANALADSLGIPPLRSATSRDNYRHAQLRAWRKRKAKEKI